MILFPKSAFGSNDFYARSMMIGIFGFLMIVSSVFLIIFFFESRTQCLFTTPKTNSVNISSNESSKLDFYHTEEAILETSLELASAQDQLSVLQAKLDQAHKKLVKKKIKTQTLKKTLKENNMKFINLEDQLSSTNKQLHAYIYQKENLQRENRSLNNEIEALKKEFQRITKALEQVESRGKFQNKK